MKGIQNLRVDYSGKKINIHTINNNPINEFKIWFKSAQENNILEPNAMTLSTFSDTSGINSRTVLLKGVEEKGFIFYTNYNSRKGVDINNNNNVSLVFLWKEIEKQIIVKGKASKISKKESKKYFESRPRKSKIAAWASKQSSEIKDEKELNSRFLEYEKKFLDDKIPLPDFWGGYIIVPDSIEFWIGRKSRMHDRIIYLKNNDDWVIKKLYP
ncbi:MAG: pyridoxamine 5'-phosphate oxidase [Marinoscillum sp.]|nr:pyridoxamine 5'-phosphate oxidase [Marinoscillum sp.]OUX26170.1 MAG: pyridoxamine 5'-phosphate oxidase [Flammeovirgaceae bacterium TMED262]|tara:strand:- start:7042 stop:7680 length:639 start_codon:yes stop_codon:yes gene_type:complete